MTVKSKKLTKHIKKAVCTAAMNASPIVKEIEKLEKEADNMAMMLVDVLLARNSHTFHVLPESFFPATGYFWLVQEGEKVRVTLFHMRVRVPDSFLHYKECPPTLNKGNDHYKRHAKIVARIDEKRNDLRKARDALYAVMDSCNTTKQLLALWPEAEQFLPAEKAPATNLPMEIHDLNSILGLNSNAA